MISFNKDSAWDLKPIPVSDVRGEVNGLLIDGEEIAAAFKTVRDQLILLTSESYRLMYRGLRESASPSALCPIRKCSFSPCKPQALPKSSRIANLF